MICPQGRGAVGSEVAERTLATFIGQAEAPPGEALL
jgi:hypothetical protein